MTDKRPLKANYSNGVTVSSISEFQSGDTVPILFGGTGVSSLAQLSSILGLSSIGGASYVSALLDTSNTSNAPTGAVLRKIDNDLWLASGVLEISDAEPEALEGKLWYDTTATVDSLQFSVNGITVTTSAILTGFYRVVYADCTSNNITLNTSAIDSNGRIIDIQKIDSTSNTVTITGSSGTYSGAASISLLNQYDSVTLHRHNNNWYIL